MGPLKRLQEQGKEEAAKKTLQRLFKTLQSTLLFQYFQISPLLTPLLLMTIMVR
jgi:hypothetical protein